MHETTASDLVQAAAASDPAAWQAIVDRYLPTVRGVTRGFRLGDADAADVAQTVWVQLLRHIDRLRDPARLGGWVATTARNECRRLCRQQSRLRLLGDESALDATAPRVDETLPLGPAGDERVARMRWAVASLPPRQRAVLELLMSDPPTSYGEIADRLDIPIGSIGPTRQRSLRSLRRTLTDVDLLAG